MTDSEMMVKHIDEYIAKKKAKKRVQTVPRVKEQAEAKEKMIEIVSPQEHSKSHQKENASIPGKVSKPAESVFQEAGQMVDQLFAEIRLDREEWLKDLLNQPTRSPNSHLTQIYSEGGHDQTSKDLCSLISGSPMSKY